MDSYGFGFGCVEENLFLVLVLVQVADADGPPAACCPPGPCFWLLATGGWCQADGSLLFWYSESEALVSVSFAICSALRQLHSASCCCSCSALVACSGSGSGLRVVAYKAAALCLVFVLRAVVVR